MPIEDLATHTHAGDFDTYDLGRVGILPVTGPGLDETASIELQQIFYSEFAGLSRYEIVLLKPEDLAEIDASDPYRHGVYRPETVIGISRRYRLDGMLVATVVQRQTYQPQKLGIQVDLVSAETGMAIWNGSVNLTGDRESVALGLEAYYGNGMPVSDDSWSVALLSPSQFARFAAWQLASGL